jgi:hypothetical protein
MVEQLEDKDEKDAPDDAHYLSNINRDVTEETRSEISNLHKDADKAKASAERAEQGPREGPRRREQDRRAARSRRVSWRSRPRR